MKLLKMLIKAVIITFVIYKYRKVEKKVYVYLEEEGVNKLDKEIEIMAITIDTVYYAISNMPIKQFKQYINKVYQLFVN